MRFWNQFIFEELVFTVKFWKKYQFQYLKLDSILIFERRIFLSILFFNNPKSVSNITLNNLLWKATFSSLNLCVLQILEAVLFWKQFIFKIPKFDV